MQEISGNELSLYFRNDILMALPLLGDIFHEFHDFSVTDLRYFDILGSDHRFQHPYNGPP